MLKVSLFAWFIGPWNPNNRTAETAKGNNIGLTYFSFCFYLLERQAVIVALWRIEHCGCRKRKHLLHESYRRCCFVDIILVNALFYVILPKRCPFGRMT